MGEGLQRAVAAAKATRVTKKKMDFMGDYGAVRVLAGPLKGKLGFYDDDDDDDNKSVAVVYFASFLKETGLGDKEDGKYHLIPFKYLERLHDNVSETESRANLWPTIALTDSLVRAAVEACRNPSDATKATLAEVHSRVTRLLATDGRKTIKNMETYSQAAVEHVTGLISY